jgi:hypothetical protein
MHSKTKHIPIKYQFLQEQVAEKNNIVEYASEKTYPSICGKNSSCGSLYFGSYTLWKIGFVASPETSQNQVFRVKMS